MTPIKTILHPTDFSANAMPAFRLACALARDYGAKLLLLYVRPLPVAPPTDIVVLPPEPAEYHDVVREKLEALRPEFRKVRRLFDQEVQKSQAYPSAQVRKGEMNHRQWAGKSACPL